MSKSLERAKAFDEANPQLWDLFCAETRKAIREGVKIISARAVFGNIRTDNQIKFNDRYIPYYPRKFAKLYPQYRDRFEFREIRS